MTTVLPHEKLVLPNDPALQYTGRIDDTDPLAPVFQMVGGSIRLRLEAKTLRLEVTNVRNYWNSYLGVIADGAEHTMQLPESGRGLVDLSACLHEGVNDLLIYKRQDACHGFTLHGLLVDQQAKLYDPPQRPARRMEVYGDSVSAGEVSEAEHCCGMPDPKHDGEYSNSWYSYPWLAARRLGAELHAVAQGGAALLDKTGYFSAPDYIGMNSIWDKVTYNPALGDIRPWDFARWQPHVVLVAIGQNDAHPVNVMEEDYHGDAARRWRSAYADFIRGIRGKYPRATIILATTILNHSPRWDDAIDQVCRELQAEDGRIHHFLYSKNGCGTPGHVRASEAAVMAEELSGFVASLGEEIWRD